MRAERAVMVAINNNLSNKFKIVDSNLSSDKTNELFAELFALMSSSIMSDEHFTESNKEKLASVISEKALINQNINKNTNSQLTTDSEKPLFENEIINNNDIELAKSLVQTFYKEFGIESHPEAINKKKTSINQIEFFRSLKPENHLKKEDLNKIDDFVKLQNLEFNITKKTVNKQNPRKKEIDSLNFKDIKFETDKGSERLTTDFKNSYKTHADESKINLIQKKSKKKNKQLNNFSKDDLENKKLKITEQKLGLNFNINKNIKTQNFGDNKVSLKKDIKTNDIKFSENNKTQTNIVGKEFLDLLESSWGEKFSKIIKNSIKNNLNKIEIELKPKNLGKLSLEVSVKNNKTIINLSSENQEVVNILNENFSKFEELAEKENKAFASFMNNNQNGSFSNKKNKGEFSSEGVIKKKKENLTNLKKINNHNIDVNA